MAFLIFLGSWLALLGTDLVFVSFSVHDHVGEFAGIAFQILACCSFAFSVAKP